MSKVETTVTWPSKKGALLIHYLLAMGRSVIGWGVAVHRMAVITLVTITVLPGSANNETFSTNKNGGQRINEVRRRKVNLLSEFSYWPFLQVRLSDHRNHFLPYVDQAIASDPELQKLLDYPLVEIQRVDQSDGYLFVLPSGLHLNLFYVAAKPPSLRN